MIDPKQFGVSFSIKQCRNLQLNPHETLDWLISQGWCRFRLMSYWNEHEKQPGELDFSELDWQLEAIAKAGGVATLCIGVKQPRWPEYHWPSWAWEHPQPERDKALLTYIQAVVKHCKDRSVIISWQLENEALLSNFGQKIDIDRSRLRAEYRLVRSLDVHRPILMSTSNGWGVPIRRPLPNVVGFSLYLRRYEKGLYRNTVQSVGLHRIRKFIINYLLRRPVFIHELQCEPWGPKPIWMIDTVEQDKSMSPEQIHTNIAAARAIGARPVDLWGGEWWYWRWQQGDKSIWQAVSEALQ